MSIIHPSDRGRPFLRSAVEYTVAACIIIFHHIWVLIFLVGGCVVDWDRQHHISDWVSDWIKSNGLDAINTMGRYSISFSTWVHKLSAGPTGQCIAWAVDSVASGVHEGVNRGMRNIQQPTIDDSGTSTPSRPAENDGPVND